MICVTEIKTLEVPEDWQRIDHYLKDGRRFSEMVKGTRIVTQEGREICIGMSKQANELLGLPFEVIRDQKTMIERCWEEIYTLERDAKLALAVNKKLRQNLDTFINMSRWERLKFLVKGKGEKV